MPGKWRRVTSTAKTTTMSVNTGTITARPIYFYHYSPTTVETGDLTTLLMIERDESKSRWNGKGIYLQLFCFDVCGVRLLSLLLFRRKRRQA